MKKNKRGPHCKCPGVISQDLNYSVENVHILTVFHSKERGAQFLRTSPHMCGLYQLSQIQTPQEIPKKLVLGASTS